MELPTLTTWKEKERNGWLACESSEWRDKRLQAEDPNTTADVLNRLMDTIVRAQMCRDSLPLAEAIAAHANTRPYRVLEMLDLLEQRWAGSGLCYAFCQNPILPFLPLEAPGIWQDTPVRVCQGLLREPQLPPHAATAFSRHTNGGVTHDARLHIAVAGSIPSGHDGIKALTSYWQAVCRVTPNPDYSYGASPADWNLQLAKLGMAPAWAAGIIYGCNKAGKAVPNQRLTGNQGFPEKRSPRRRYYDTPPLTCEEIVQTVRAGETVPAFTRFTALLHGAYGASALYEAGQASEGIVRLLAALGLPMTCKPFEKDPWKRSPMDLLHHLARDGNRFVRWAAQTRLADPDFVFAWHEGDEVVDPL